MRIKDVTPESKFYQDEKGQWRYRYSGKDRMSVKAVTGICTECGEPYVLVGQPQNSMCSRSCAGRKGSGAYRGKGNEGRHWKGGRIITHGYYYVFMPDHPSIAGRGTKRKYIRENRLVMEQILGRLLRPYETVHHRNGNTLDNSRTNLAIRIGAHGPGASGPHCQTCTCFEGIPEDVLERD